MNTDLDSHKDPRLKDDEILSPFMEYLKPACIDIKPGGSLMVYMFRNSISHGYSCRKYKRGTQRIEFWSS